LPSLNEKLLFFLVGINREGAATECRSGFDAGLGFVAKCKILNRGGPVS
jgi:hypothetical protein